MRVKEILGIILAAFFKELFVETSGESLWHKLRESFDEHIGLENIGIKSAPEPEKPKEEHGSLGPSRISCEVTLTTGSVGFFQ